MCLYYPPASPNALINYAYVLQKHDKDVLRLKQDCDASFINTLLLSCVRLKYTP